MKKAALNLLVRNAIEQNGTKQKTPEMSTLLESLRMQFMRIDEDKSGLINASELAQAMKNANIIGLSQVDIENIIAEIDYVGNGKISYHEFLAATLSFHEQLSDEMLLRLFKRFDLDDSGQISKENLLDAFKRLGRNDLTMDQVTEIIRVHDLNHDNVIEFSEFKAIFKSE